MVEKERYPWCVVKRRTARFMQSPEFRAIVAASHGKPTIASQIKRSSTRTRRRYGSSD